MAHRFCIIATGGVACYVANRTHMENQLRSRTKLTPAKKQGALGQFFGPEVAVA